MRLVKCIEISEEDLKRLLPQEAIDWLKCAARIGQVNIGTDQYEQLFCTVMLEDE